MPLTASNAPADTDILCEGCGYTLNGLPNDSRCPECGKLIIESTDADGRSPLPFDSTGNLPTAARQFLTTTAAVIFRPTRFFRSLPTRINSPRARIFALIHAWSCSLLFAMTAYRHMNLYGVSAYGIPGLAIRSTNPLIIIPITILTFAALHLGTILAAKLTAWEARLRGLRLPYPAIRRAMHFHSAHYLPVAGVSLLTVEGFWILLGRQLASPQHDLYYLYVLCIEVLVSAAYLFWTYWIAMRNIMYANR